MFFEPTDDGQWQIVVVQGKRPPMTAYTAPSYIECVTAFTNGQKR